MTNYIYRVYGEDVAPEGTLAEVLKEESNDSRYLLRYPTVPYGSLQKLWFEPTAQPNVFIANIARMAPVMAVRKEDKA